MIQQTICLPGEGAHYTHFQYPGGEIQVRLNSVPKGQREVTILARITCHQHVMELIGLVSALRGNPEVCKIDLHLPLLPYARADRRFVPGDCAGLEMFGGLLNSLGFSHVVTLDVHNAKEAMRCVHRLVDIRPKDLIRQALEHFAFGLPGSAVARQRKMITVLLPDEGAKDRYLSSIPELLGSNIAYCMVQTLCCAKVRDAESGKLLRFDVPEAVAFQSDDIIIIDDICDGGGTFNGIAERLEAQGQNVRRTMGLFVTHGIFSKGLGELRRRFETIITTNSFRQEKYADVTLDAFLEVATKISRLQSGSTGDA